MRNILITGASGLIGSSLINLFESTDKLFIIETKKRTSLRDNTIHIECDLSKEWDASILPPSIESIIHLAQYRDYVDVENSSEKIFNVNTASTLKLLEYAKKAGAKSFVYASSGGIYARKNESISEDDRVLVNKDLGFYLGSKLCSEVIIKNHVSSFSKIILRYFFVYGQRQNSNNLIYRLINRIKVGDPVVLYGEQGILLNPTFVEDAACATYKAIGLDSSEVINITGPEILSIKEICDTISTIIGKKPNYQYVYDGGIKNCIGNNDKMKKLLHLPSISFGEGIKQMF